MRRLAERVLVGLLGVLAVRDGRGDCGLAVWHVGVLGGCGPQQSVLPQGEADGPTPCCAGRDSGAE